MTNILLPTDFSENSWNAINYALHLYQGETCTFHFYNAYTPMIYNIEYTTIYPAQFGLGDSIKETSEEGLSKIVARIPKKFKSRPNLTFETVSRFDTLISGMMDLIDERHIDIIIMGTKGATANKEVLFGSNTIRVFKYIRWPVLAIPSGFQYESPMEILFPTDLNVDFKQSKLDLLLELAVMHHSRINALHVATGNELSETQNSNLSNLTDMFKHTAFLYHEHPIMKIPEAINEFQLKTKVNLIAMINNKHSFFENLFFKDTIEQIGFHLNIPFLLIPSIQKRNGNF